MNWYIVIRKTLGKDRDRIISWANIDGVQAESHTAAQLLAYQRNSCKPDQLLHAAKMHSEKDIDAAIELWSKRNRQNAEFARFMQLERVQ